MQVEHVRLGIPTEVPLAVQQWEGCIAVNYAARAAGIVRHERVSEALRKVRLFFSTIFAIVSKFSKMIVKSRFQSI